MKKSSDTQISEDRVKYSGLVDWDTMHQPFPLYKYCSYKTALNIIKSNKIKLSPKSEFNDPFDVAPVIIPTTRQALRQHHEQNPNFYREQGISESDFEERLEQWGETVETATNRFNDEANKIKIYCLTENENNILIWSHYADSHTGVCLEFINPGAFLDTKGIEYIMFPCEVKYVSFEKRPILDMSSLFTNTSPDKLMAKLAKKHKEILTTKYDIWGYEKEWRALLFFKDENAEHLRPFDANISSTAIKSCTFGVKTTDAGRKKFMKKCQDKGLNIQFKQAQMHGEHYALEYKAIL